MAHRRQYEAEALGRFLEQVSNAHPDCHVLLVNGPGPFPQGPGSGRAAQYLAGGFCLPIPRS